MGRAKKRHQYHRLKAKTSRYDKTLKSYSHAFTSESIKHVPRRKRPLGYRTR